MPLVERAPTQFTRATDSSLRTPTLPQHVKPLESFPIPAPAEQMGAHLAAELRRNKAIMGIFDEGCMGMYNAIIPDELLHATGVFKERLSQSALFAEMQQVPPAEARAVKHWLDGRGIAYTSPWWLTE